MKQFTKWLLFLILGVITNVSFAFSQSKITGTVVDEKGEPLIGVQVIPVGAVQSGGLTDFDGKYNVSIPSNIKQLKFTYMGFQSQTVDINSRKVINITMKEDSKQLEAVVVTAMGIKRESKTLTYSTQSIDNKDLTRIKESNFINSLQGKSAGLTITPNNSGAGGGSTRITLRGQNSILGSNQPLIVLDGVPLSNGQSGQTTDPLMGASKDGGDILSTINPDDIASITVLKGPNAAALYGSSANNGVIVITTKSGRDGKVRVDFSSSTSVDFLALYPKLQDTYTLGESFSQFNGWGKKVSDLTDEDLARYPYVTRKKQNVIRDFFQTGVSQNTSVIVTGGTEKNQSYFSYANTYQRGIMPLNTFLRHNVMFKQSMKMFDRLDIGLSLNYIHQNTKNRPIIGKAMSPLYALYRTPAGFSMDYFKYNYEHPGNKSDSYISTPGKSNSKLLGQPTQTWYWYDSYFNNPYWLLNKMSDEDTQDRILSTLSLKYTIITDLDFQSRTNIDYRLSRGVANKAATTYTSEFMLGGQYASNDNYSVDFFQDALLSYNKKIAEKVSVQATAGGSWTRNNARWRSIGNYLDTAAMPNILLPQNNLVVSEQNKAGNSTSASDTWGDNWNAALFATASVGYDEMFYLDGSYRVEWAKSFQQFAQSDKYISFSFYSVGANALLDRFIPKNDYMSSLKLRASYSLVGNPIPNQVFAAQSINFRTGALSAVSPKFENPRPETTTSFETGIDGVFLKNKLDVHLTYYNSTLRNQFLYLAGSSGQSIPVNTGKIRNYGVEFTANYNWNITKDITWSTGFNIAYNDNKILETYVKPDGTEFVYTTGPNAFKIKYLKGGAYGDIYVNSFERNTDGTIKTIPVNEKNMAFDPTKEDQLIAPVLSTGLHNTYVGNATAKINFGWNNTISYKNLSLYFLIDGKIGGKVMSLTQAEMDYWGVSQRTADARERGFVELPDGSGRKVDPKIYYTTIGGNPIEDYIYDATNFRLRQLALSYTFYDILGPSKNISLGLTASNLFFIYKKSPVDPDISVSAANGFGGIDAYAMPTTRNLGFTAKITF